MVNGVRAHFFVGWEAIYGQTQFAPTPYLFRHSGLDPESPTSKPIHKSFLYPHISGDSGASPE